MWPDPLSWEVQLLLVVCALMSLVTLGAFGLDKVAARRGRRRVPESTLLWLSLLGGWPGALLGMSIFRHKRRKAGFKAVLWLIVLAHTAAWAWAWA